MGLLSALRSHRQPAVELPAAWRVGSRGRILLRYLGEVGFTLRNPYGEHALSDQELEELGVVVAEITGIAERRDAQRCLASAPGKTLSLVREGAGVVVYDETGQFDIGRLDDELARMITAAMGQEVPLRVMSLYEVKGLDGRRTDLRALIAPESLEMILAVESPTLIDISEGDEATVRP